MNLWIIISLLIAVWFIFNHFADSKNESTVASQTFQSTWSMVQKWNVVIPDDKVIKNYWEKVMWITLNFKWNAKILCKDERWNDVAEVYPIITRFSSTNWNAEMDLYQPYDWSWQNLTSNDFHLDTKTALVYQYVTPITELKLYNPWNYEKINIMFNKYCFVEILHWLWTPLEIDNIEKITTKSNFWSGDVNNYNVNGNNLFFNIVE